MLRFASSIFSRRPQPKTPSKTATVASPSTEVPVHTAQFFAGYVVDDGSPVIEDSEPLILDVKRVARRYNQRTGYYADEEDVDVVKKPKDNTLDAKYAFSIVRKFHDPQPPETSIYVRSPYFLRAAKVVMKPCNDINWTSTSVQFRPQQLLAWLPRFKAYLESCETHLKEASSGVKDTQQTVKHLQFFVHLLEDEHKSTLAGIDALLSEGKITFDLLWAIFLPGDVVISHCEVTGEPIATRLVSATSVAATPHFPRYYQLQCEFVDFNGGVPTITGIQHIIRDFEGPRVVSDLKVFPMEPFLPQDARAELRDTLIKRGKRCTELSTAWCHKRYSGIAYKPRDEGAIGINSRIVLDRTLYDQYELQTRRGRHTLDGQRISAQKFRLNKNEERRTQPTDDELMLMPAVLYGFSLGDRRWLRFNIEHVEDIVWNPVAFDYLDIPQEQKNIVRTLTESHARNAGAFDDFIEGKGVGLVFNLHGPPGVGKTLTAEATSEIARSPLYVVSAGDLGITATELDASLTIIFALAKAWKAVVLIDEADVFLEQRDLHDLARNAMVAVFLRQLEYFPGILMLTTNRVNIIDHAIKSRIHVSLLYDELDGASRKRLWRFFLAKAGLQLDDASDMVLGELAQLEFNGREIKNIVKVAVTFAAHHNRTIAVSDITQVIESNRQRKRGKVAGFDVVASCVT